MEGTEQPQHNDYVYALRDEAAYLHADDDKPQTVESFEPPSIVCQFCGKPWEQVAGLFEAKCRVRDPNTAALAAVWICNECVTRMAQVLAEEPQDRNGSEGGGDGRRAASCDRKDWPCHARPADPVAGRGGPDRRRRPRPDGTGTQMLTNLLTGPAERRRDEGERAGTTLGHRSC